MHWSAKMRLHELICRGGTSIIHSPVKAPTNTTHRMFCPNSLRRLICVAIIIATPALARGAETPPFPSDPAQHLERTSFQTSQPWSPVGNLRSDVAMVYGIDKSLPDRVKSWRDRGYRVHLMTGVAWGHYQDYLYGRFDGTNHEDNAQTDRDGKRISHGGDVYYMCPAANYGEYLSQ